MGALGFVLGFRALCETKQQVANKGCDFLQPATCKIPGATEHQHNSYRVLNCFCLKAGSDCKP